MSCISPVPVWQKYRQFGNESIETIRVFDYRKSSWYLSRDGGSDSSQYDRVSAIRILSDLGQYRIGIDNYLYDDSLIFDERFWQVYDEFFRYRGLVGGSYAAYDDRKKISYEDLQYLSDGLKNQYKYAAPVASYPCGICLGCSRDRSKDWALRCSHEMQYHKSNCFITLTYNDDNIPENGNLIYSDFQKFMKRLRIYLDRHPEYSSQIDGYDGSLSYFVAGEYGHESYLGRPFGRPHFHAILFGIDFPDKYRFSKSGRGFWQCRSEILEKLWDFGFSSVGEDANYGTAMYTAKYITKDMFIEKYVGQLENYYHVNRPMIHVSGKYAIGKQWLTEYWLDIVKQLQTDCVDDINIDTTIIDSRGRRHRCPRYYLKNHPKSELIKICSSLRNIPVKSPYQLRVEYDNLISRLS